MDMKSTAAKAAPDVVKSAHRALQILELLSTRETPLSFIEISRALGYPLSSLHGLLRTLVEAGWAAYDESTRSYALGIRTLEAGNAYLRSMGLPDRARPVMEEVRDAVNETVQLAVLNGREAVYVAKVDGGQPVRLDSEVGRRLPAHATGLGKVLLADLSREAYERLVGGVSLERLTEHTVADPVALARELARIRQHGYGLDGEECTVGVCCVAVPIFDYTGSVVAAMSVTAPTFRFGQERREQALLPLRQGAARLSAELGHRPTAELGHQPAAARRTRA